MKGNHVVSIKVNESETDGGSAQSKSYMIWDIFPVDLSETDSYWENLPTHDLNWECLLHGQISMITVHWVIQFKTGPNLLYFLSDLPWHKLFVLEHTVPDAFYSLLLPYYICLATGLLEQCSWQQQQCLTSLQCSLSRLSHDHAILWILDT